MREQEGEIRARVIPVIYPQHCTKAAVVGFIYYCRHWNMMAKNPGASQLFILGNNSQHLQKWAWIRNPQPVFFFATGQECRSNMVRFAHNCWGARNPRVTSSWQLTLKLSMKSQHWPVFQGTYWISMISSVRHRTICTLWQYRVTMAVPFFSQARYQEGVVFKAWAQDNNPPGLNGTRIQKYWDRLIF